MKLLITLTIASLIALSYAAPSPSSTQRNFAPFGHKFDDMYKYLTCVPNLVDQLAAIYKSEKIWEDYRPTYLTAIDEYEECAHFEDDNLAEECQYAKYARAVRVLSKFYGDLHGHDEKAFRSIPIAVADQCVSDEMRFDPDM